MYLRFFKVRGHNDNGSKGYIKVSKSCEEKGGNSGNYVYFCTQI